VIQTRGDELEVIVLSARPSAAAIPATVIRRRED
jgi:hypothetical protein